MKSRSADREYRLVLPKVEAAEAGASIRHRDNHDVAGRLPYAATPGPGASIACFRSRSVGASAPGGGQEENSASDHDQGDERHDHTENDYGAPRFTSVPRVSEMRDLRPSAGASARAATALPEP